jgi:hypothetical protein
VFSPVAVDPREQRQIVVPACDLERVELDHADPVEDALHALRPRRQRPRGREEVPEHEEAACCGGGDGDGLGHGP